jgi:hypothetical protein
VDKDISDHSFSASGRGVKQLRARLFKFKCSVRTNQVTTAMRMEGYRPGTLLETLAFAIEWPKITYRVPLIALGSSWIDPYWGFEVCPGLTPDQLFTNLGMRRERHLSLFPTIFPWFGEQRFLGIRDSDYQ